MKHRRRVSAATLVAFLCFFNAESLVAREFDRQDGGEQQIPGDPDGGVLGFAGGGYFDPDGDDDQLPSKSPDVAIPATRAGSSKLNTNRSGVEELIAHIVWQLWKVVRDVSSR